MTSPFILSISTVVFVAALGSTGHFSQETWDLEANLRTARSDVSQLKNALAALREKARRSEPETKPAASVPKLVALAQPVEGMSEAAIQARLRKASEENKSVLLASPSLQVLFEESRRGIYRAQFAALFHRLKLTPEEQAAFISALVSFEMKASDLEAVMKQHGLSRDDPALKAQRAEADATILREIQAVLGPDASTITREYTKLNDARSYVAGYGGLFSRLGQPLTFYQLEALANAFGEASPGTSPNPNRLSAAQWDQIGVRAQGILTPNQWQIFQSTTSPGQSAGRWESVATEAMDQAAGASGDRVKGSR